MIFMSWKDKQCIISINEVISGKSVCVDVCVSVCVCVCVFVWGLWGVGGGGESKKLVLSQNKRPCYNLETFECNHEKLGTQSET